MYLIQNCSVRCIFLLTIYKLSKENVLSADFSPTTSTLNDSLPSESVSKVLESINGTQDYRINTRKDQNGKPWHDERKERYIIHCVRPAKCEKIQNTTCFGSKMPYGFTSLALTDSLTQAQSREELHNFEALRNVPKCWAVIQVSTKNASSFERKVLIFAKSFTERIEFVINSHIFLFL